jgi:hypothetical protein
MPLTGPEGRGHARADELRTGALVKLEVHRPEAPAIAFVDELGRPLKKAVVRFKRKDGREFTLTTDEHGKVYPDLKPGEDVEVALKDGHEGEIGDGATTPSGRHLAVR